MQTKPSGFTLIEVMITVAIIAILSAIAIPRYNDYIIRGRIPEATGPLSSKRVQLEQFFQDNRTYVGAPAAVVNDSTTSTFFTFTTTAPGGGSDTLSATGYTLYAVGRNAMAGFTYTVNQANARTTTISGVSSSWDTTQNCWVVRTGGQC